jgi:hypothetical protein
MNLKPEWRKYSRGAIRLILPAFRLMLDESTIHATVARHLHVRGVPGLLFWHTPNGGYRLPTEAKRFVGLGTKPGVADLILLHAGRFFALELKAHSKSRVSKAQKQFVADVRDAGGEAEIAFGLDHALRVLEDWQLLRGHVA